MIVRKLRLRNFRNYERAEIEFSSGLNLFVGLNAQGKTNLLESLVYLSLTRSHRITDDTQMIRHGCPFAEMECEFEDGIEKRIGVRITQQGKTHAVQPDAGQEEQRVHRPLECRAVRTG
jgi:DNA replication and repair protein RecF